MSTSRSVENALRTALEHEDASIRRRLPTKAARPNSRPEPKQDKEVIKSVSLGEADLARAEAMADRCLPDLTGKRARSTLLRAGLLALDAMSEAAITQLVARLPTLENNKEAGGGRKKRKR